MVFTYLCCPFDPPCLHLNPFRIAVAPFLLFRHLRYGELDSLRLL